MFSIARITKTAPPRHAVLALLCAIAALGVAEVRAQTAGDLDCKKCVDSEDIAKKTVGKKQIDKQAISENRLKDGAVSEAKLSTDLQAHTAERESFYITLDGDGAEATIASHGPLTYKVQCRVGGPNGSGGPDDRIEIIATGAVDGWLEHETNSLDQGDPPHFAGEEVVVQDPDTPTGSPYYDSLRDTSAMAPDGSYLALEGDSGGVGLNLFGHDCIAIGFVYRLTGAL